MARAILCLALVVLLLPAVALAAGPVKGPGGYIIDNQGKKIVVERFEKLLENYPFVFEDSQSQVPITDIKSLTNGGGGKVMLENTKGKSFKVTGEMGICYTDEIAYKTKNPIDGMLQDQTIDPLFVKKIVLDWKK
jgi:hypothetical protein